MDKKVSNPIWRYIPWYEYDKETTKVISQPKSETHQNYLNYLKIEPFLEPKSQMYVREELGFDEGGRVRFGSGTPFAITDSNLAKIHTLIQNTDLSLKEIGKKIGFGTDKKPMDSTSKVFREYVKKYGEPDKMRLQTRGVKLTKDSPYVKNVIKSVEKIGVRETARIFGKDRKAIRNVLHQFRPDLIKDINVKGKETSATKSKIKATENIKIAETKAGSKTTKQAKEVKSKILEYNNPYKKMSAKNLAKDKNFLKRLRMHIDINTGAITYDGYTKARPVKGKVFTDLELADHAIKKAKQGQLFTDDHIIPKSLKKQNVGYPINFQPATYIENSNFDNARKYVLNNPKGDTSAIDKYLTKNNQTLRFPDQKIKLGYKGPIVFDSTTGSHTLVKKPPSGGSNVLSFLGTGQMESGLSKFGKSKLGKGVTLLAKGEGIFAPLFLYGGAAYGLPFTRNINEASYGILGKSKSEYLIDKHPKAKRVIELLDAQTEYNTLLDNYKKATPATQLQFKNKMLAKQKEFEEKVATFNAIPEEEKMELGQAYQVAEQSYEDELKQRRERHFSNYIIPKKELFTDIAGNLSSVFETPVSATENVFGAPIPTGQVQTKFAGGGIASLTRTVAPPRGPQYRGLDYLKYYGR